MEWAYDEYQQLEKATCQRFIDKGVPPGAAAFQARQDIEVLAARGKWEQAKEKFESLQASSLAPPALKVCEIEWPEPKGDLLADAILNYVVEPSGDVELSLVASAVRELVGLTKSPLLPEHLELLEAIATALGASQAGGRVIKFSGLYRNVA